MHLRSDGWHMFLLFVFLASAVGAAMFAQPSAPRPQFEVAAIHPCDPSAAPNPGGRKGGGAGGARQSTLFRRNCQTLETLIQDAYIRFANGGNQSPMLTPLTKLEGAPSWLESDLFTIDAEAAGNPSISMMTGPMMQSLLEDRFALKVHREERESPAYSLTIAKGGSKVRTASGAPCTPADFVDSPFPYLERPPELADRPCNFFWNSRKGPDAIVSGRSTTMRDFAAWLTRMTDRLVRDDTGITGEVDFRMMFGPDDSTPGFAASPPAEGQASPAVASDPDSGSIFTALQRQLGLRLENIRAPRPYLVIDSIQRKPTEN